ncbi:MAG: hypothetical protein HRU19_07705 [Pseudobacteriovorax sp.]|nr:hypothetical protein [Pseudobacteriovorax sp.]
MTFVEFLNPNDFFQSRIENAASKLKIPLNEDIEFYLVNLLCEFINPQNMTIDEINLMDTPLALIYKKAVESGPNDQLKVYKKLGDFSLYVAGYFQDSLNRKTVNTNYYISMGSSAYQSASRLMRSRHNDYHFMKMYQGLANEFGKLVAIITHVAGALPKEYDQSKIFSLIDPSVTETQIEEEDKDETFAN